MVAGWGRGRGMAVGEWRGGAGLGKRMAGGWWVVVGWGSGMGMAGRGGGWRPAPPAAAAAGMAGQGRAGEARGVA